MSVNPDVEGAASRGYLLPLFVLLAAGVWATWGTWVDIFDNGIRRTDAVHIFLALPVCAWLIWARRKCLADWRPRPSPVGPLLIAVGWAASSYGYNTSGQTAWHGGAVLVIVGCAVSAMGHELFRRFLPAIIAFGLIVPAPGFIRNRLEGPMEAVVAKSGKFIFDILGMDVELDSKPWAFGMKYVFRQGDLDLFVSDICQRSQVFFVVLAVAFGFAFAGPVRSAIGRALVLLSVPVVAIACDLIRLVPIVWYYGRHPEAVGDRHFLYTIWLMVPVAYVLFYLGALLLQWVFGPDAEEAEEAEGTAA